MTAGQTIKIIAEFDHSDANRAADWSVVAYGDKGKVHVTHDGGLKTQHMPVAPAKATGAKETLATATTTPAATTTTTTAATTTPAAATTTPAAATTTTATTTADSTTGTCDGTCEWECDDSCWDSVVYE